MKHQLNIRRHFLSFFLTGLALVACIMMTPVSSAAEIPMTGKAVPELKMIDELLQNYVKDNDVPGASLAIAYKGKIVYSRGIGYADKETKEPVQTNSLFRIASISKPITAVAVFQLVEQGKLKLDQRVFDVVGLAPFIEEGKKPDERVKDITIYHCLTHTSGWDRDVSYDVMFEPDKVSKTLNVKMPPEANDVLRFVQGQPLDFAPGKEFAYSNVGYCALGRAMEKVTGQSYYDYVQEKVLHPLGITDMKMGRSLLEDRQPNEVKYYSGDDVAPAVVGPNIGKKVPEPYGSFYFEPMDSHGGWLATAEDLVKFGSAFEKPEQCKLLKNESIRTMFKAPPGITNFKTIGKRPVDFYSCGWLIEPQEQGFNTSHAGALDGSSTNMVHRPDDVTFAILFNSRMSKVPADPRPNAKRPEEMTKAEKKKEAERPKFKDLRGAFTPMLHKAIDNVKSWPAPLTETK